jgi:3-dehydroquinate dehydratase type I
MIKASLAETHGNESKKYIPELIFTLRTEKEDSEPLCIKEYHNILSEVISRGDTDYADIEVYRDTSCAKSLLALAKSKKMKTIGSHHDFSETPSVEEMIKKMTEIKKFGANVVKLAVMPNSEEDVQNLLEAASEMKAKRPRLPLIAIAMGKLGKDSRYYGGLYGVDITFGTLGYSSAPGQVSVRELKKVIDALYCGKKHIILIGFTGVGKSTVADELGKLTGKKVIDIDHLIALIEGRTIENIFENEGEKYFRKLEAGAIDRLGSIASCIVSCGGGMVLKELNIRKLQVIGTTVLLTAKPSAILRRLKGSHTRPLLEGNMNAKYIGELMESRKPYYEKAADFIVSTDKKRAVTIAKEILKMIEKS